MPIYTDRLLLKPREVGEGPIVAKAVRESLEHLKPWMKFAQSQPEDSVFEEHSRKSLAEFILRTNMTLSIYDKEGKIFIGSTGFHQPNWEVPSFHIGYWIHKDFIGKGYIQEATNALTRYAFAVLKAKRLEIRCDSRNERSLNVMKKLGFIQEAIFKNDSVATDGTIRDTIVTARYGPNSLPPLNVRW